MNDTVTFPGGVFELKVYKNKKEAGIDFLSRIKKLFGFKVVLGTPIYDIGKHNKMTYASLAVITGLLGNVGSQNPFTRLAVGTSNTAVSASHTALQAEITDSGLARTTATVTQTTTSQTNDTLSLTYMWTASGSKTVQEIGVFNASSGGVMLARAVVTPISLVSGNVLSGSYTWQAVGN